MADFASVSTPALVVDATHSKAAARFRYAGDLSLGLSEPIGVGEFESGGAVFPPPQPGNTHFSTSADRESPGYLWFDRVHLLPREPLDFGIILAEQTVEFEIFNARGTPVSLNNVANNTGANSGVSVPDLVSLPVVVSPYSSIIDSSSIRLSPVRTTIVVAKEGAASIDGSLDFLFSNSQTLTVLITGTRLQLIAGVYDAVRERLQFLTEIHEARSGKEKRIALRRSPRQLFDVVYRLSGEERQRMDALLFGAQAQPLAFPLWHEDVNTTAAATATATSLAVAGAADVDFRVGGFAVIYESHTKFDVLSLSAVSDTSISFASSPLVNSYGAGARVAPVRIAILRSIPTGDRFPVVVQDYTLQLMVIDNETGALTGSTSGWSTYEGLVILDDCHGMAGPTLQVELEQRVRLIDSATGVARLLSRWPTSRRGTQRLFSMRSRAEIMRVRRLLIALNGRQKSFWQPTRSEDLTVVAPLASGGQAMDVVNVGYFRNVQQRAGKNHVRLTLSNETTLERQITASEEISATVERLTVDDAWPSTIAPEDVVRVEFIEPTRFDADEFVFNYARAGVATLRAPTRMIL